MEPLEPTPEEQESAKEEVAALILAALILLNIDRSVIMQTIEVIVTQVFILAPVKYVAIRGAITLPLSPEQLLFARKAAISQAITELTQETITQAKAKDAVIKAGMESGKTDAEIMERLAMTEGLDPVKAKKLNDYIETLIASGITAVAIKEAAERMRQQMIRERESVRREYEARSAIANAHSVEAKAAGKREKKWVYQDGLKNCPLCIGNASQGWIPIDASFSSGDMQPTIHPRCACTLRYR